MNLNILFKKHIGVGTNNFKKIGLNIPRKVLKLTVKLTVKLKV